MDIQITSVINPRVKQWAQLLDKKGRQQQGKFVIEGTHLVKEALKSMAPVETLVYSMDRGIPSEIIREQNNNNIEWIAVSDSVLDKCTETRTPQPVLAIVRKEAIDPVVFIERHSSLVVVIDGVQDPGNLGTIIRSADAVNASGVLIGRGTVDLYNPKTVRSTMGSLFHLPIVECDLPDVLAQARERSIQLVNTSLDAKRNCYEIDMTRNTWLIVGNEGQGVSDEVARHVDTHIKIPMPGQAESLNVAMATTVLLYEALRQRQYPNLTKL